MGFAILSGVLGGGVLAMSPRPVVEPEQAKLEAAIDARLHELLVEMRERRQIR